MEVKTPSTGYVPLFRGDFKPADDAELEEILITGRTATGTAVPPENYLAAVREAAPTQPELVQNIARVVAATIFARVAQNGGTIAHRYAVEGCRWGHKRRTGAEIMQSIAEALPWDVKDGLAPMQIRPTSNNTRREITIASVLAEANGDEHLTAITHGYHQPRAQWLAKRISRHRGRINDILVAEPRCLIEPPFDRLEGRRGRYLQQLIRAGEPSERFDRKERRKERWMLGPLTKMSWYGPDVEGFIADHMPGRQKPDQDDNNPISGGMAQWVV